MFGFSMQTRYALPSNPVVISKTGRLLQLESAYFLISSVEGRNLSVPVNSMINEPMSNYNVGCTAFKFVLAFTRHIVKLVLIKQQLIVFIMSVTHWLWIMRSYRSMFEIKNISLQHYHRWFKMFSSDLQWLKALPNTAWNLLILAYTCYSPWNVYWYWTEVWSWGSISSKINLMKFDALWTAMNSPPH